MDIEKFKCEKGILIDVVEEKVIKKRSERLEDFKFKGSRFCLNLHLNFIFKSF